MTELPCPFCKTRSKDGEINSLGLPSSLCPNCGAQSIGQCDDCLAEVFEKDNEWKCWRCGNEGKPSEHHLWENL